MGICNNVQTNSRFFRGFPLTSVSFFCSVVGEETSSARGTVSVCSVVIYEKRTLAIERKVEKDLESFVQNEFLFFFLKTFPY